MIALRSILFNFLFYGVWTPFMCIGALPVLLVPGHKPTVRISQFYQYGTYLLEKFILGLDYEIRGIEFKPKNGTACLVAAKHFSAYETLKLFLLFDDPAIILKRELLSLPVFGWFLRKLEVIAVDRGNRAEAMDSLYNGARRVQGANRPIVIFPQGTRVSVNATPREKPYKGGIAKLYKELNLPIIPVAMNSGLYWPRNSFWKKPGTVIFEFLPPIPTGLSSEEAMKMLEDRIETATKALIDEGRKKIKSQ